MALPHSSRFVAKEAEAAAPVKLLSAEGSVSSGCIVLRMISHTSTWSIMGEGLRIRSPKPSTGEPDVSDSCGAARTSHPTGGVGSRRDRGRTGSSDCSSGGVGRTALRSRSDAYRRNLCSSDGGDLSRVGGMKREVEPRCDKRSEDV